MDAAAWPQLQTERWYHPGCAVIGRKVIIAGGSRSPVSQEFSTGAYSRPSLGSTSIAINALGWCTPRCDVMRHKECCFNPTCLARRRKYCQWILYLGGSAGISSGGSSGSSSSYGDNQMIKTCEVIDLDTRTIVYGGELQGPDSFLQLVTFGQGNSLVAFARAGSVRREDMVIWNPTSETWNRNFPFSASSSSASRFGAALVSKDMICPAN